MSAQPSAPTRRTRLWRTAAAFVVLLGLAGYLLVQYLTGGPGAPRCTVRAEGDAEAYELSPEQAANAATISAVASSRGLPERAVTIALATAMQESGLRNIHFGDRDSVGLFQQRPSQDWGTVAQIMDPVYSAGEFYTHLAKVPGYSRLPLTVAAQKVQRSGYPQAYAKHEANATQLSGALTGRDPGAMTCTGNQPADGKVPGVAKVREKLVREFGPEVLPRTGGAGGRAAGGGQSLTVPVQQSGAGATGDTARRGWELATWALAHSDELHIEQISYAGRTWTAADAEKGWQGKDGADAAPGRAAGDVRITAAQ
ncbi:MULTISPECIES: heavy metal transporter [Streptomyces]|uniref:Heavy metal transporter n=2 Tax=Streptomyces TaxID=1883 RepID=A0A4Q9HQV0_STRKA|nr:heavy metal transporter [Streptomyces kasugaensis]TBO57115.1 heavy metal transporter [Streptomyces kasugaensis]WSK14902.1 heavy metal transporter [Streptomyces celluloflavus]